MSYYLVRAPHPPRIVKRVAGAIAAASLIAIVLIGWVDNRPVQVVIDGRSTRVPAGTTVQRLADESDGVAPHGDLFAVDGSVLATGQGDPPRVIVNGARAKPDTVLHGGDDVVTLPGGHVGESLVITETPIPFKTVRQGSGSLAELQQDGEDGVERVVKGKHSGIVVRTSVVRPPRDAIIVRTSPTPGMRVVALTFDDGPWPSTTQAILKVLKQENVRATFFMLGVQIKRNPGLAAQVRDDGHFIGSHTLGHRLLTVETPKEVRRQIWGGRRWVERITGAPAVWMRPPYGAMDAASWKQARRLKTRVAIWDVDSDDWSKPGVGRIVGNVIRATKPGSVILMHDGGGDRRQTVAALPYIIRGLKARGYRFATVDEIAMMRAQAKR